MSMIELFVEDDLYRRIALKEDGVLTELQIEEKSSEVQAGDLYLAIIKKKVKAIKSVFVDIGARKNGFLYVNDLRQFEDYKEGQSILVEVLKEEEGSKGAKVTDKISLGGRFVVLFPGKGLGFSKKLDREKFLDLHGNFMPLEGFRVLFREASMEASREDILDEIEKLHEEFLLIYKKSETGLGPLKLFGHTSVLHRVVRDYFSSIQMIYVNHADIQKELMDNLGLPSLLHKSERSLFEFYGIEDELQSLRQRRVFLKDGGNLVIEETEAMVVIDVNSAKHKGSGADADYKFEVNLQAAAEIARQIRLRNLSGIIVIDFIDVKTDAQKERLKLSLEEAMEKDSMFGKCYPVTELGLLQLTRKKRGYPIYHYLEEACSSCRGHGVKLSYSYVKMRIRQEITRKVEDVELHDYHVVLHTHYEQQVRSDLEGFMTEIEGEDKKIYLEFRESTEDYMVKPLVFKSQISEMEKYLVAW